MEQYAPYMQLCEPSDYSHFPHGFQWEENEQVEIMIQVEVEENAKDVLRQIEEHPTL